MPDGVGERDDAVALEEDDAEAVDEAAARQLVKTVRVVLKTQSQTSFPPQVKARGPNVALSTRLSGPRGRILKMFIEMYETKYGKKKKKVFDKYEETRTTLI